MKALEATHLIRSFGTVKAVRDVSFAVSSGEIYGLVGPDGAGKTTTIRLMAGLVKPDGGEARVFGKDPLTGGSEVREQLGLMPQQYSLYSDLSIAENLRFFGQLFCLPRNVFRARADRLLNITRLAPFVDRRAGALSGGMYKKLALSCALLHEPRVLLLDEPTNGVDPISRRELWALLHEFVGSGMAIVVSTPYMDEAERCHRVGLLHEGRLLAEGAPEALVRDFDHEVLELSGPARDAVESALSSFPEVAASSPSGEKLRLVVRPFGRSSLEARLSSFDVKPQLARPEFEDLFLVRTRGEGVWNRPSSQ